MNDTENGMREIADEQQGTNVKEICKAKELLRANGYILIPYRETGAKIKCAIRSFGTFLARLGRAIGGYCSEKVNALKARHAKWKKESEEIKRIKREEAAQYAETVKNELRLAELRAEEARLKVAAVTPATTSDGANMTESNTENSVATCASCGTALLPNMRFCRKCGAPISTRKCTEADKQQIQAPNVEEKVIAEVVVAGDSPELVDETPKPN